MAFAIPIPNVYSFLNQIERKKTRDVKVNKPKWLEYDDGVDEERHSQ